MSKTMYGWGLVLAMTALGGSACADAQTAPPQVPAPGTGDENEVVATVGDRKFTLKEVEARWQEDDPAERARVTQLLYQHRRQSIDQLVGDHLIEAAAKKAGQSKEAFLTAELDKRRGAITDADVQRVYDENRDRVGASTVADLKDSITRFIAGNRDGQNLAILVNELKAGGPAVNIALDPPRYDVAIAAHDPARGPADAPVTIVEFSEYQCPFCARVTPTLKAIEEKYAGKVRFVFKDFPLQNHLQAPKAAEAAHCAGDQGKYLGAARSPVRQPAAPADRGTEEARRRRRSRSGRLRHVPRFGQAHRGRAGRHRARQRDGREFDADALHQRARGHRRAAAAGLRGHHRRGTGQEVR